MHYKRKLCGNLLKEKKSKPFTLIVELLNSAFKSVVDIIHPEEIGRHF